MALSPREFVEEVEKYSNIIEQRKNSQANEITLNTSRRVNYGLIDFSDLLPDLKEITISLQRLYITQHSINNLSALDSVQILRKARVVALAGITEYFKTYNNKEEESFWHYYSKETGLYINDAFYNGILEPVLIEEGILDSNWNRTESLLSVVAREAGFSPSLFSDVLYLFNIYRKYFYPNLDINSFIDRIDSKKQDSVLNFIPGQTSEREDLLKSYKRLLPLKSHIPGIMSSVNCFTGFAWSSGQELNLGNFNDFISEFNQTYDYHLDYFKNDELKRKYLAIFPGITLSRLTRIIKSLPPDTKVAMPDKQLLSAEEVLAMPELYYGVYHINGTVYTVLPNPTRDISYYTSLERDRIIIDGNKIIIRSVHEFSALTDFYKSYIKPVKLFRNGKPEGYLWYGNKPVTETLSVKSEKVQILPLVPAEALEYSLDIKLKHGNSSPVLELQLDHAVLISENYKNEKINIINTDQYSSFKQIAVDANGVGYSGQIVYPVRNKRAGRIDLFLTHNKEILHLKDNNPDLTCYLEDIMLFDSRTKTRISPSQVDIACCSSRLMLFSTIEFENRWVNDACEVNSYGTFGDYNIYEIEWVNREQPLSLKIDYEHKWTFLRPVDLHIDPKETNYDRRYIKYAGNQFHSIKDVNLVLNAEHYFELKNLAVKLAFNFGTVVSDMLLGTVNSALGRSENNGIIDEAFIAQLMNATADISYGRYSLEFTYHDIVTARFDFFVIPALTAEERTDIYTEDDDVVLALRSSAPCFRNNKTLQNYLFDKAAQCRLSFHNKIVASEKIKYLKKARLYSPFTEVNLSFDPDVICFRFTEDNRLFITDLVDFYNIHKTSLVVKTPIKDVKLKVNNNMVTHLVPNNMGIITEPLEVIKNYLNQPSNDVTIQIGSKYELYFQVMWHPKVTKLVSDPVFTSDQGITFTISYEGPVNSYLKLFLTDELSRNIEIKKITCGQDSAPKFVRYDLNKNCLVLTCDGKKWEDRTFTIHVEPKAVETIDYIYLKGVYDYNNASFGELVFRNEGFVPEIKRLNDEIAKEPDNPYLYCERGFLFSDMNQFHLAKENFDKSVSLGLDDPDALNYIELFNQGLVSNMLAYELGQLTHLAKKLYTEELLLEVE